MLLRNALFTLLALTSAVAHSEGSPSAESAPGEFRDDLIARLEGIWHLTRKIRGTEVRNDSQDSTGKRSVFAIDTLDRVR